MKFKRDQRAKATKNGFLRYIVAIDLFDRPVLDVMDIKHQF